MDGQAIWKWLMIVFTILISTQAYPYMEYEDFSLFAHECPKECVCPLSFPRAMYCENKGLKEVPPIPSRIWYLYLQNNLIETLTEKSFEKATELKWINLSRNNISSKGIGNNVLKNLKNLLYLFIEDNNLEEVPNPLPESLEQLRVARNKISKIPEGIFSNLGNLTLLDLHQNKISDNSIPINTFNGLKSLVQLNVAKNSISKMPLGLPTTIVQLYLDNNNIEAIPNNYFKDMPKVAFLRLNYNKVSDKGVPAQVFNITSMLDLQLSHNELTSVPHVNGHLERLHLDNNKIKSLNATDVCPNEVIEEHDPHFPRGPRLRYLRLDGNEIQPPIPLDLIICFRLLQTIVI
ncbi:keratocan [Bombina bombina]|uniref:keratocan n=1 Tax=Bombina bombina TaxID=8345 RepID=UPI00235B07B6|nr:keratocan [Bombina bombina]XP_053572884.1 keratocan [Bombina bombina]XP_053572885.1 keratocan [Bombina bombina]